VKPSSETIMAERQRRPSKASLVIDSTSRQSVEPMVLTKTPIWAQNGEEMETLTNVKKKRKCPCLTNGVTAN
jgi:hypothetical protein